MHPALTLRLRSGQARWANIWRAYGACGEEARNTGLKAGHYMRGDAGLPDTGRQDPHTAGGKPLRGLRASRRYNGTKPRFTWWARSMAAASFFIPSGAGIQN